MSDKSKALADMVRRFIDSSPVDDKDCPYICEEMQSEFEALQKALADYDAVPAAANLSPTPKQWDEYARSFNAMHCPRCGSNARKLNGGAVCDCGCTWVADTNAPHQ